MFGELNKTLQSMKKTMLLFVGVVLLNTIVSSQPLAGIYTIGGVSPDYLTINDAVSDLELNGTSAPVTFNIRPGVYNEFIKLDTFSRVNPTDVVLFQSETQGKNDVIIEHLHNYWTNYTILVNGADNIQFKHLTIQSINPYLSSINIYNRVILVVGDAENILFEDNIIKSWYSTAYFNGGQHSCVVVGINSNYYNNFRFLNNIVTGGFYGINYEGGNADGLTISGNLFKDQYKRGIRCQTVQNTEITNNNIQCRQSEYNYVGIDVYNTYQDLLIENNSLFLSGGSTGISVDRTRKSQTTIFQVSNNMICLGPTIFSSKPVGILSSRNDSLLIAHNTVNIFTSTNQGYCFQSNNSDTVFLLNNILSHNGGGLGYYSNNNTNGVLISDYNNLFNGGNNVAELDGIIYNNVGTLFSLLGIDQFSISYDPFFLTDTLLIPFNPLVYETGTSIPTVSTDFFGNLRSGTTPDIGIYEGSVPNVDAGIVNSTLVNHIACPGDSIPFYVTLRNFGNSILTSVDIAFGTSTTIHNQVVWTGSLNQFQEADSILLGYIKYDQFIDSTFMSWSFNPNGQNDSVPINDTLILNTTSSLTGVYTIGDTLRDFQSFTEAVNKLIEVGVCGPVVFNVDSGEYQEQIIIPEIQGASIINTITFQSASLDSTDVVLKYGPTSGANYVLILDGADYISIKHMTLEAYGSSYRRVISIKNEASNNSFLNNIITSPGDYLMRLEALQNNNNLISNNRFVNGGVQLYIYSIVSNRSSGTIVLNNSFEGSCSNSIQVFAQNGFLISQNKINGFRLGNNAVAISIEDCIGDIKIEKNQINISGSNRAVEVEDSYGSITNPILFRNNFVTYEKVCLFINNSTFFKLINNSFNHTGNNNLGIINVYQSNPNYSLDFYNNAFNCTNGGKYYDFHSVDTSMIKSDYNAFYTTGLNEFDNNNTNYSLTDWQTIIGLDQNSVFTNIGYASSSDLHIINSIALYETGIPLTEVIDDIDFEPRDPITPDIGADEFEIDSLTYHDVYLVEVLSPDSNTCSLSDSLIIKVYNKSNFPITSFDVKWWIYGTFDDSLNITQVIPPLDTIIVNLGQFTFAPNTEYSFDFQIYNPNGQLDNYFNDNTMSIDYYYLDNVTIFQKADLHCTSNIELFIKNFPRDSVLWSTGSFQDNIIISTPGTYSVTVTDNKGCVVVDSIIIN